MIEAKAKEWVHLNQQSQSTAESPFRLYERPEEETDASWEAYYALKRARADRVEQERGWIAQNLTSDEIRRLNMFINKYDPRLRYTAPPKEVVRVDVRHRKTNYLPVTPASVPAPASGSLRPRTSRARTRSRPTPGSS